MKSTINNVAIFHNLPSGGAKQILQNTLEVFKTKHINYRQYTIPERINNIFKQNIYSYLCNLNKLNNLHKNIANRINKKHDYAIIHHSWITKSPFLLRYINIPTIYVCHEVPREFYDKDLITIQGKKEKIINILRTPIKYIDLKNVRTFINSQHHFIIANSKFSKKIIDTIYKTNSYVVYPGINITSNKHYLIKSIKQAPQHTRRFNIISVGAINPLKRQKFIVKVIGKLNKDIKQHIVLTLIGNGIRKDYVKKIQRIAYLSNVNLKIKVNLPNDKLLKAYENADIFMYAPINEPFGLVILEAMNAGLPIIAYKKGGGYTEILESNILMSNLNVEEWSKKLLYLIHNYEARKKISQKNLSNIKKFSREKMIERYISILTT